MEGFTSDLLMEASEVVRWVENIRQSPYFHSTGPYDRSRSLQQFRDLLMKTSKKVKEDYAAYLNRLNGLKERAENQLATSSTFCDNCSRFIEWLDDCEARWAIPAINEKDNPIIKEDMFLWEKQTLASSHKVSLSSLFLCLDLLTKNVQKHAFFYSKGLRMSKCMNQFLKSCLHRLNSIIK